MSRPIRVLVTGGGGAGTLEILRTLKASGRYFLVAVDAAAHASGLALADRGYVVPMATVERFADVMEEIVRIERSEFVIPLVDEEIVPLHALAARHHGRVVAPSVEFCRQMLDKWQTFGALHGAGIPTPWTCLAGQVDERVFPAAIKPRDGRGSRELAYLEGPDELEAYVSRASRPADHYVVQQRIIGQEYTVSVVVALGGPTLAVVPKEVIVKRGITQVGITRVAPEIERVCRRIQDRLHADGPFNVQLIMDRETGAPYVIEINPRYSTTVALTIAAGINEVDVVIRHALGEAVGSLAYQPNLLMIRSAAHQYLPEDAWPPAHVTNSLEPRAIETRAS
jgi:carbamoyl-phosphate synthase large subunit